MFNRTNLFLLLFLVSDLPCITIFTLEGKISENGGEFAGMHRFECRVQIEKKLTELKLMVDKKPNEKKMQLPRCSRSGDVIEYMLIPQWWMDCTDVARRAVDVSNCLMIICLLFVVSRLFTSIRWPMYIL